MPAPSVFGALLIIAAIASGCIPKERSEQEARADASAHGAASSTARAAASPLRTDPNIEDAAVRRGPSPADSDPLLTETFVDRFDRSELGDAWRVTSSAWRLKGGRLCAEGARNRPVWLARRIPTNARVEFDALSLSADGDIKAELWGDGLSGAVGVTYDHATSYLAILGGWKNRIHVLARLDEHANDRTAVLVDPKAQQPQRSPIVPNQLYHFQVERRNGHTLRWLVNRQEIAVLEDQAPLAGSGHDHVGFNDWETAVCFDNLNITPL